MVESLALAQFRDSLVKGIEDALKSLVAEQREELQSEEFQSVSVGTGEELLEWFRGSYRFRQTCEEASRYLRAHLTNEELKEVMHEFAGGLYQGMAYGFLAAKQPQPQVLLSPERTFEFYQKIYPGRNVIKHSFELDSLEGISVPDGIIVGEHDGVEHIVAVCEYTLVGDNSYFQNKYTGFWIHREHFPQILSDAYLLFVVPEDTNMPRLNAKVQSMPFTHKQFGDYVDDIILSSPTNRRCCNPL